VIKLLRRLLAQPLFLAQGEAKRNLLARGQCHPVKGANLHARANSSPWRGGRQSKTAGWGDPSPASGFGVGAPPSLSKLRESRVPRARHGRARPGHPRQGVQVFCEISRELAALRRDPPCSSELRRFAKNRSTRDPGTGAFQQCRSGPAWMAGTSPAMTALEAFEMCACRRPRSGGGLGRGPFLAFNFRDATV
jgi:hypothetical protein